MHFVGMLAARLPFPVDYLVFPTLLSFLVCVIVVGAAVFTAAPARRPVAACRRRDRHGRRDRIDALHRHVGAARERAHAARARFVVASVVIAIATSGLALWLAGGRAPPPAADPLGKRARRRHHRHALYGDGGPDPARGRPGADQRAGAVERPARHRGRHRRLPGVSGIFLLTLVPDRKPARAGGQEPRYRTGGDKASRRPRDDATASLALGKPGRGLCPLGGAGGPPRRFARHLPVERDGITHYVAVDSVVAVHANAHYTYIFDGTAKLFCPLPISDVEARLDTSRFLRVPPQPYRQYRAGGAAQARRRQRPGRIDAADAYAVPVSRSRVGWLKSSAGEGLDRLAIAGSRAPIFLIRQHC